MLNESVPCLILACGNTLRQDDGLGPYLAQWAEARWSEDRRVRVLWGQQWTPEMAEDIAQAHAVIFVDCAADCEPGLVHAMQVEPAEHAPALGTHHLDAAQLLSLSEHLYGVTPRSAFLLTVGAASLELREGLSTPVLAALPAARALLAETVHHLLSGSAVVQRPVPA